MDDRNDIVNRLKAYFNQRPDVVMAFIFGSQAKGYARKSSDWDVGVYFFPGARSIIELETEQEYSGEHEIWSDIEKITGSSVDFVVLNRVAPPLVFSILNRGLPLAVKDRSLYLALLSKTHYEAVDFWQFTQDYMRIYERSRSLSSEDKSNLIKHLVFLENEFKDTAYFQSVTQQQYVDDRAVKRNIERWVENMIMASLDIAKIALASEKRDIPDSYREILRTLGLLYFDEAFANSLALFAELRNLVAHEYLDLRWKKIKKFTDAANKIYPIFLARMRELTK